MAGRSRPGAVEETTEDGAGARNQGEASADARDPLFEPGRGGDRAADPAWARAAEPDRGRLPPHRERNDFALRDGLGRSAGPNAEERRQTCAHRRSRGAHGFAILTRCQFAVPGWDLACRKQAGSAPVAFAAKSGSRIVKGSRSEYSTLSRRSLAGLRYGRSRRTREFPIGQMAILPAPARSTRGLRACSRSRPGPRHP